MSIIKEKVIRHYIKAFLINISILIATLFCLNSEVFSLEVKKKLDNGTTVVCHEVEDSSLVTVEIRVMSGLSNEGEYAGSGISHFLEHLLFKGTNKNSSDFIRKKIKSMGGIVNGATGMDSAEYYITIPREYFDEASSLLIDMVLSLVFTEDEFKKEREVIMNEISLYNDDPSARSVQLLFSKAYSENVYKNPIIGLKERFALLTAKEVSDYHAKTYTLDRMVIGVAGGIKAEDAIKKIETKLKEYSSGHSIDNSYGTIKDEPSQLKAKVEVDFMDRALGYIAIGFHTSSIYSSDIYPGDVLSVILGEGDGSRLYEELVKNKRLLYTVSSTNYTPKYPGLFVITGIGDPDKLSKAREAIFSIIGELRNNGINENDLVKARSTAISTYLHSNENINSIVSAMTISEVLMGYPDFSRKYLYNMDKIKEEDVYAFISKYMMENNSTSVFIFPNGYESTIKTGEVEAISQSSSNDSNSNNDDCRGEQLSPINLQDESLKVKLPEETSTHNVGANGIRPLINDESEDNKGKELSLVLDNGLKIILKERKKLPLVALTFACYGGLSAEEPNKNGISNLVASLLLKGTKTRSDSEIVPEIELKGGNIGSFSGMDIMGIQMDVLSSELESSLKIFEDVIINPSFPDNEIEKIKEKTFAIIGEQEKDIYDNTISQFRKLLYEEHPYSRKVEGEFQTVSSITREDIVSFHENNFSPNHSILTVVGDIDITKTSELLKSSLGKWDKKNIKKHKNINVSLNKKSSKKEITMEKEQSLLIEGCFGAKLKGKDKYTLDVISALLSGSDGILFKDLREDEGLTYASGAISIPEIDTGFFIIYVATSEENLPKAEKILEKAISRITKGEISNEDIESSKNRLITQKALSLETNHDISFLMATNELSHLGYNYHKKYTINIHKVTKQDIIKTAHNLFNPKHRIKVIAHSSMDIRDLNGI